MAMVLTLETARSPVGDRGSVEPKHEGNRIPMVAKAKAVPRARNQAEDAISWDSQTTSSCSDEGEVCAPGFAWEALTVYPTTVMANAAARKECKEYMPLQVLHKAPACLVDPTRR